jgi:hypothetical protein
LDRWQAIAEVFLSSIKSNRGSPKAKKRMLIGKLLQYFENETAYQSKYTVHWARDLAAQFWESDFDSQVSVFKDAIQQTRDSRNLRVRSNWQDGVRQRFGGDAIIADYRPIIAEFLQGIQPRKRKSALPMFELKFKTPGEEKLELKILKSYLHENMTKSQIAAKYGTTHYRINTT